LTYSISDNASWMTISPSSGTTSGEVDTIEVSFSTSRMAQGTYHGKITASAIGASNSPQEIDVVLTINAAAMGDINGDSAVNSGDAILALRIAAGLLIGSPPHTPTATEISAADVNHDAKNTSADVILILQMAAGLIEVFP
jgi:hypothetical protein